MTNWLEDQGISSYDDLLASLKNDLYPDPRTDLIPPALVSAQGEPWTVDAGLVTFVFTAAATSPSVTVAHNLGRKPLGVWLQSPHDFIGSAVTALTALTFTADAFDTVNIAGTANYIFYWMAIG